MIFQKKRADVVDGRHTLKALQSRYSGFRTSPTKVALMGWLGSTARRDDTAIPPLVR